jgi:two-component system response regulator DesR
VGLARREPLAGREARYGIRTLRPYVALTDIENARDDRPGTGLGVAYGADVPRVVILMTFARPGYLRRALDAGVSDYVLKAAPAIRLAETVHACRQVAGSSRACR